jgi:hypothetical protein
MLNCDWFSLDVKARVETILAWILPDFLISCCTYCRHKEKICISTTGIETYTSVYVLIYVLIYSLIEITILFYITHVKAHRGRIITWTLLGIDFDFFVTRCSELVSPVLGKHRCFSLTVSLVWSSIIRVITICSPFKVNRRFGGTYRFHLQGWRVIKAIKPATWRYIPDDRTAMRFL